MKAGDIEVGLRLNDDGFSVQIKNAGNVVKELKRSLDSTATSTKRVEDHVTSFSSRLRYAVTTISLARGALTNVNDVLFGMPRAIATASGEIERMTKLMEGLARSSAAVANGQKSAGQQAKEWGGFIFDMAKNAPFDVKALTDSFVKLKVAGLDPTDGSLKALTDSVAKYGGSSELLKRASVAIQQMGGKGVISMEELRQQLGEAVPDAIQLMADGVGMSMADLVKKISLGRVEASSALDRMFTMMKIKNDGAAAAMMDTWTGQLARLSTEWTLFLNEAGNAGGENSFFNTIKGELTSLNQFLGSGEFKRLGADLGQTFASIARGISAVVRTAYEYGDVLKFAAQATVLFIGGRKIIDFLNGASLAFQKAVGDVRNYQSATNSARAAELSNEIANNNAIVQQKAAHYAKLKALQNQFAAQAMAKQLEMDAIERRQGFIGTRSGPYRDAARDAERLRANAAAIAAEAAATQNAIVHTRGLNAEKEKMLKATTGLASKIPTLGMVMGALGGPIGIITTALIAGGFAWYEWGRQAKEAIEGARRNLANGMATLTDYKALADEQLKLTERQKQLEQQREAVTKNAAILPNAKGKLLEIEAEYKANGERLKAINADVAKARTQSEQNSIDNAVRINDSAVRNLLTKKEADTKRELDILESKKINGEVIEKAYQEQLKKIAGDGARSRIKIVSDAISIIEKRQSESTNALAKRGFEAQKQNLLNAKASLERELAGIERLGSTTILDGGKGGQPKKTSEQKQEDRFKNFLQGVEERIAGVNAELGREVEGTVARLLEKADGENFTAKQLDEIKVKIGQLNESTNMLDIRRVVDSGAQSLAGFNEQLGGGLSLAGRLTAELDRVAAKAKTAEQLAKLEEGYRIRDQIQEAQDNKVIRDLGEEYIKRANDIKLAQATEREAINIRYQQEIANIEATFRKFSEVEARKPAVQAMRLAAMKQAQERFEIEMRTPGQRMVKQWEDATRQMQNASTKWTNDVIDGMVNMAKTGKFEFGDMVESILTDMLRISYQKQLGGAIQGIFDGLAGAVGGAIGGAGGGGQGWKIPGFGEIGGKSAESAILIENLGDAAKAGADQAKALAEGMTETAIETGVQSVKSAGASTTLSGMAAAAQAATAALNQLAGAAGGQAAASGGGGGFFDDILGTAVDFIGGFFGNGGVDANAGAYSIDQNPYLNMSAFANGGIMTEFGSVALRKYALGGIANTPQMALFGEGSMPEAYVPLPDGRTIPVTMTGGAMGGAAVTVNVINNADGTTAREERKQNADGSTQIDVIIEQVESKISQNVAKGRGSLSGVMEKTYGLNRSAGSY